MAENRSCLLDMGLVKSCGDDGPELVALFGIPALHTYMYCIETSAMRHESPRGVKSIATHYFLINESDLSFLKT